MVANSFSAPFSNRYQISIRFFHLSSQASQLGTNALGKHQKKERCLNNSAKTPNIRLLLLRYQHHCLYLFACISFTSLIEFYACECFRAFDFILNYHYKRLFPLKYKYITLGYFWVLLRLVYNFRKTFMHHATSQLNWTSEFPLFDVEAPRSTHRKKRQLMTGCRSLNIIFIALI